MTLWAMIVCLIAGATLILAVAYKYSKRDHPGLYDVFVLLIAAVLCGMSVWPTMRFKLGGRSFEATLEQRIEEKVAKTTPRTSLKQTPPLRTLTRELRQ